MEKFSYNLREHFQDNSVDFSESNIGGSINNVSLGGNPDFNHEAPTLWKYLGIHNMSKEQIDCNFECVKEGLDCSGDCGDFNKKCNNECTIKTLSCVKSCMEQSDENTESESPLVEEEEAEEETKETRTSKKKQEPRYYDGVSDVYAAFYPSKNNSYKIETNHGVYGDMVNKVLDDQDRADELLQYSKEMRVKFS